MEKFEQEWARVCKAKYCVAVSSGTDALYLALAIFDKYRVWTTPKTFIAVAEAAQRARCELRFYDNVENVYIPHTSRASSMFPLNTAVPVSLYGIPHNEQWPDSVRVIEDLAQAHGHPLRGFAAAYSFYPTKNLGAIGQAGAIVTNNSSFADEVRHLRNHGEKGSRFSSTTLAGGNYRMDELQAAILRAKLPHLDAWNKRRREIAKLYSEGLTQGPVYGPLRANIKVPVDHPEHVYYIYAIESPHRDSLAAFLKERSVQTAIRYPIPLHLQPALAHLGYKKGDFPDAERGANETLSLPINESMSDGQVEYVIEQIREWANARDS